MELLETEGFPNLLKAGRWALTGIETALSIFLIFWFTNRPLGAWGAMGILFAYNIVVLVLIYRLPLQRIPIVLLIALDLVFLTNACVWTQGIGSPFLGQFYLIVFVAALFYNLRGGLIAGVAAGGLTLLLAIHDRVVLHQEPDWKVMRDTAPYFPIIGGFTGFLVREMKRWFERYRDGIRREDERHQADEARTRELELARQVQQLSLPSKPPVVAHVELALRAEPSREVGGDLHVFVTDPAEELLALAIGDVSGKGLPAALVATSIGYLLPYLNPLNAPHAALVQLNQNLCERLPEGAFATLIYAELTLASGEVRIWNAGHPGALIWRVNGARIEVSAEGDAAPLGMFPGWRAAARRYVLEPGDVLVLYSDGLSEARNEAGEAFGDARLAQTIGMHASSGPEAVAVGLVDAVQAFGTPSDDITLIVCQRSIDYPGL